MKFYAKYSGDVRTNEDFGEEYTYLHTDYDLTAVLDTFGKHLEDSNEITHAIVKIGDGDYDEIWVTTDSRYYDNGTTYERIDWGLIEDTPKPRKVYRIIINQPGYMPESEPYDVDTLSEAKDAIRAEIADFRNDGYVYRPFLGISKLGKADLMHDEQWLVGKMVNAFDQEYCLTIAYVDESL